MAVPIYIVKRKLKGKRKNGEPHYRYSLRWRDPLTGEQKCESAGTADLKEAKDLRSLKYAEVNGYIETAPEPEPEPIKPSWQECRDALKRDPLRLEHPGHPTCGVRPEEATVDPEPDGGGQRQRDHVHPGKYSLIVHSQVFENAWKNLAHHHIR